VTNGIIVLQVISSFLWARF